MSDTPAERSKRRILLLPFAFFIGSLVLAVALSALNAAFGSLNTLPGERLWLPAVGLIALYALALNTQLRQAGLAADGQATKLRRLLQAVSTLAAAPVLGLMVAPAINGLGSAGPDSVVVAPVARIESSPVRRSRQIHYFAHLHDATPDLPPGRYFMGRYDRAWSPADTGVPLTEIRQVSVRYRTGQLGARTLLAVEPATN